MSVANSNEAGDPLPSSVSSRCTCRENIDSSARDIQLSCNDEKCCYKYLTRDTFTSEIFKIQLKNIHPYTGFNQLKKLLDSLKVKYRKVKLLKGITFLTFGSKEDRDEAIAILDGYCWKGQTFMAKVAMPQADPLLQKRQADSTGEDGPTNSLVSQRVPSKRMRLAVGDNEHDTAAVMEGVANANPLEQLLDAVSPLWRLPYFPDQINLKRQSIQSTLADIRKKLTFCNPALRLRLPGNEDNKGNAPSVCPLLEVVHSPIPAGYRNKAELTIGCNLEGEGPLIGFRLSKYRNGLTAVGQLTEESNVLLSSHSLAVVQSLQQFLIEYNSEPQLATFNPITHEGHWRHVLLREARSGDLLLLADLHPQDLSQTDLTAVADKLRSWFSPSGPGESTRVTSLYMATRRNSSEKFDADHTRLLLGQGHIVEHCFGLKFRVSIDAFFQINTLAAELLYKEILRFATKPLDTLYKPLHDEFSSGEKSEGDEPSECNRAVLLDVCCGTGTIGLCLAKYFHRVVGIEMVDSAIEDAKLNAVENDIQNVDFYAGRAEDVIRDVLKSLSQSDEIVAVVDPPRAGLHSSVVQALRRCDRLHKIVYVACNLQAATTNLVDFARPISNRFQGTPFVPVLATAVDLFPQTRHVETVLLLHRADTVKDQLVE